MMFLLCAALFFSSGALVTAHQATIIEPETSTHEIMIKKIFDSNVFLKGNPSRFMSTGLNELYEYIVIHPIKKDELTLILKKVHELKARFLQENEPILSQWFSDASFLLAFIHAWSIPFNCSQIAWAANLRELSVRISATAANIIITRFFLNRYTTHGWASMTNTWFLRLEGAIAVRILEHEALSTKTDQ